MIVLKRLLPTLFVSLLLLSTVAPASAQEYTEGDLRRVFQTYSSNEIRFKRDIKTKRIVVNGTFETVKEGAMGWVVSVSHRGFFVMCSMSEEKALKLAELDPGDRLKISGSILSVDPPKLTVQLYGEGCDLIEMEKLIYRPDYQGERLIQVK